MQLLHLLGSAYSIILSLVHLRLNDFLQKFVLRKACIILGVCKKQTNLTLNVLLTGSTLYAHFI